MAKVNNVGIEFRSAMMHYVTSLIDKRNFAGVVQYYEANASGIRTATDTTAGRILRLVAGAYASLSNYPVALKTARVAQSILSENGDTIDLAELFVTLGGILRELGETREAEKAFRDAESIFRRNDCAEGQSRALNLLAGLFYRNKDYKGALTALLDAISIARLLGDKKKLAFMMGNIGRIYTFIGDFTGARKHLDINIQLSGELGDMREVVRAKIALGYVYLQEGDYSRSERVLNQAASRAERLDMPRDLIICRSYLGEMQYRKGELEQARKTLEGALSDAEQIGKDSTLTGRILRHLAQVHLILSDHRTAQRLCARALGIVRDTDQVEYGALLKIKALLADAAGNRGEGKRLMMQAIDVLQETGVRSEIAQTRIAAGVSTLFDRRHRLTHLFHAEEFYAHYELRFKLAEVQKEIAKIDYPAGTQKRSHSRRPVQIAADVDYLTDNSEIKQLKKQLAVIAQSDLPVLFTGETGVGKDHMARYYHSLARPGKPYVAINCASIPKALLESELFGYERGAFTGAERHKDGLFVAANGGVLLLDEIGDMPLELQTKLLGVLERRRVMPLGTTREVELDLQLVAATNQDLEMMVEEGSFRRDLYYRLSGISFNIPPLRERKEDIPLLMRYFMKQCRLLKKGEKLSPQLVRQFVEHNWPGNTRELHNQVKRLEVMADMVADGDLVELSRSIFAVEKPVTNTGSMAEKVEQFERQLLIEALITSGGNKSEAARMLGIHEATVRTKLKRYAISVEGGIIS